LKVSAFTFLRNGSLLGYPYVESIRSVLPIVDEFVVNVGFSQDDTLDRVRAIGDPKIRILESAWNEKMADRGYVYAQQKMIAHFNCTGDWAFYLEGDEVVHEQDLPAIRASMERHLDDARVEALVFDYLHFYGTPQQLAVSPGWYRRAPRIIRNSIRSYSPDGLFFVVMDRNKRGRYPRAALANAPIYHYGHVRSVARMQEKIRQVSKYWGHTPPSFRGYGDIDPQALAPFTGTHPRVVQQWLAEEAETRFAPNAGYQPNRRERRHRRMMALERLFGLELSKKHYTLVRDAS
jgi:hypothetical protein